MSSVAEGLVVRTRADKAIVRFLDHILCAELSSFNVRSDCITSIDIAERLEFGSIRVDGIVIVDAQCCYPDTRAVGAVDSVWRRDAIGRCHLAYEAGGQEGSNTQRLADCGVYLVHFAKAALGPDTVLFGEDCGSFPAELTHTVEGGIGGEEVKDRIGDGEGGGMDCCKVEG